MRVGILVVCLMAGAGVAQAQTGGVPAESDGYIEVVAQSAFGNVTSQSFGVEAGYTVRTATQVFVEVGQARDTSPSTLGANAQLIAGALAQSQSGVGFSVRQPMTFGVAGIRYIFPTNSGTLEPYVMAGGGIARIKKDVKFTVGSNDVTSNLQQFGIVLGSDLTGSETKPMLSLGLGVAWPAWRQLVLDLQYRYGRVFTSDEGLNVNRAGIGVGIRF
jgi:opacity protein-like surface antigen